MNDDREPPPNLISRWFAVIAGHTAALSGHPLTFLLSCGLIAAWSLFSLLFPNWGTWQPRINTVTTIITVLMVFAIQATQNRDAVAVQAKLDELIRALEPAKNQFIGIEKRTIKEVHELRQETVNEIEKLEDLVQRVQDTTQA